VCVFSAHVGLNCGGRVCDRLILSDDDRSTDFDCLAF